MENYFDIGVIVGAQGIKGEVRVKPVTDDPDRFGLLDAVYVVCRGETRRLNITSVRRHKAMVLLKLAGIDDRTAAEAVVGGVIKIPPEQALPLAADEYYIRDLLGMTVWTQEGERLGVLTDVRRTGANDVYTVTDGEHKEILIPAIKQCILSVSVQERRMRVHLMEGLRGE